MDVVRPFLVSSHRTRLVFRHGSGIASAQPSFPLDSIEEVLRDEPLVLVLRGLVEAVLGERLRSQAPCAGGYSYDPVALFATWMFALMEGVRSSRKLERACRYDDRYKYLCGGCRPDHVTLSRFRKGLGEGLDGLFAKVSAHARGLGRLAYGPVAVDGTRIPASRSSWRRMCKGAEDEVEPEAATMCSQGRYLVGYNLQAAVDVGSGLVSGFALEPLSNDLDSLGGVLASVQRQGGGLPSAVVADKGYDSLSNAHALDQAGVPGYLPKSRSSVSAFVLEEDGVFRCLAGKVPKERRWVSATGREYRDLRVHGCAACPLRAACGGKGRTREMRVPLGGKVGSRRAANLRCETEEGAALLRARGPTVELVFARLKEAQGLRRFLLRGSAGARLEFGLHALAHNLRRLLSASFAFFGLLAGLFSAGAPRPAAKTA
jgi:transposase